MVRDSIKNVNNRIAILSTGEDAGRIEVCTDRKAFLAFVDCQFPSLFDMLRICRGVLFWLHPLLLRRVAFAGKFLEGREALMLGSVDLYRSGLLYQSWNSCMGCVDIVIGQRTGNCAAAIPNPTIDANR